MFSIGMNELASFGTVVRFWVGTRAQVVIRCARDAEKVLKDMTHHVKSDSYHYLNDWMGHGLLNLNGKNNIELYVHVFWTSGNFMNWLAM
jgi:hypothetical protein